MNAEQFWDRVANTHNGRDALPRHLRLREQNRRYKEKTGADLPDLGVKYPPRSRGVKFDEDDESLARLLPKCFAKFWEDAYRGYARRHAAERRRQWNAADSGAKRSPVARLDSLSPVSSAFFHSSGNCAHHRKRIGSAPLRRRR
jgi:hypothetical protein